MVVNKPLTSPYFLGRLPLDSPSPKTLCRMLFFTSMPTSRQDTRTSECETWPCSTGHPGSFNHAHGGMNSLFKSCGKPKEDSSVLIHDKHDNQWFGHGVIIWITNPNKSLKIIENIEIPQNDPHNLHQVSSISYSPKWVSFNWPLLGRDPNILKSQEVGHQTLGPKITLQNGRSSWMCFRNFTPGYGPQIDIHSGII